MKKLFIALSAVAALTVSAFKNPTTSQIIYDVDTAKSTFNWHATKTTGEHEGNAKITSGKIISNKGLLTGGDFEVDMTSITVTDITDPGMNTKLTGHLKSDDFFSVEKNPKANFKIKVWAPRTGAKAGEPNYLIKGDLTIKGITSEISFPAAVEVKDKTINASAEFKIDRAKYDVRFGSKTFFPSIGDRMIDDEFTVKINLSASVRQL